ncbi:MAG: nucleotidyltransferase domain-containing protein [Clostridiales bacterium]|nr:nucleotidyltransferase domain-containing protein [Clostridiales bacterium]
MRSKQSIVINKIANRLKDQSNVIGVILFGSFANGTNHNYSDIDLFAIGHNENHRTECFNQDGVQIQIIWRSPDIFKEKIMKRTRTYPISKSCKILYDKTGEVDEFVNQSVIQSEEGPLKLSTQERLIRIADLSIEFDTIKGIIEQGDIASGILLINDLVMTGIDLYYDLMGAFLVSPKKQLSDLKLKNSELGYLAESIILENSINEKVNKLKLFREIILKEAGGEIDQYELVW